MRTLYLATGPELVHGMITDLLKHDMAVIGAAMTMAVSPEEDEDAPSGGWTSRDTVSTLGQYTLLVSKLYTPTVEGRFSLWGRWTVSPETVTVRFGTFQVR